MRRGSRHGIDRQEWRERCYEFVPRGSQLPQAKLDEETVRRIRAEHVPFSRHFGAPALARRYGLHVRTVERVLSYAGWRHVR